jgi:signal transduction histidine kinase
MSRLTSLLRALKKERTNVYRLIGLVLFAVTNLLTVTALHFHHDGQLRYLQYINLVTGIVITTTVIYGAFDMSKRSIKYEKVKNEKAEIHSKFMDTQQLLFRIDNQTRQEVGAWLHGTLQPQLVRLAKNIREKKETDLNIVAQQIDDICEKFVRAYSHELFPPELYISLEVALETLLEGRAELVLDERLTNASSFGFSVCSPESGLKGLSAPLRLVLDVDRRYAVYRIIEEAVANAEKKSSTSQIVADIRIEGEEIRLSVRDNGSPILKNTKPGLGLSILYAYVKKFDGSFSLENIADGVELIALIPYAPVTAVEHLNRRFHGEDQSA